MQDSSKTTSKWKPKRETDDNWIIQNQKTETNIFFIDSLFNVSDKAFLANLECQSLRQ